MHELPAGCTIAYRQLLRHSVVVYRQTHHSRRKVPRPSFRPHNAGVLTARSAVLARSVCVLLFDSQQHIYAKALSHPHTPPEIRYSGQAQEIFDPLKSRVWLRWVDFTRQPRHICVRSLCGCLHDKCDLPLWALTSLFRRAEIDDHRSHGSTLPRKYIHRDARQQSTKIAKSNSK